MKQNLNIIAELYDLISNGMKNVESRKQTIKLRKEKFSSILLGNGFTKVAFDTRRIDQETEYNPRRGLQNYNRSEQFISEAMAYKLISLSKLKNVLDELKIKYGKEPEWQDSNARVLLSTLENGLRTNQQDGDFTDVQPAMGSLDYIEELLDMRYRLKLDNISKLADYQIKDIILNKDEELIRKNVNKALEITKNDVANHTYDTLMDKLFNVHATKNTPEIERTITIVIKDKILGDKLIK